MAENFSVFKKGGGENKPELIAYYDEWGWIDFLIEIARTKMFDVDGSGLDSVESAKKAKAYKVLIYASSERDKGVAIKDAYDLK